MIWQAGAGAVAVAIVLSLPCPSRAQDSVTPQAGAEAWARIYAVTSHPRCTNCHVGASGRPAWEGLGYDRGRLHGMNIRAGASRIGAETIPCRACHIGAAGANNRPHAAPQIDDAWRLPPVDLAWRGKSSAQVCAQLRSPDAQDGSGVASLIEHVRHSAFVRYGFAAGAGRSVPAGSADALATDLSIWAQAGKPCPAA